MLGTVVCGGVALLVVAVVALASWAAQRVPPWNLHSSTVLISGGSAGIGLEVAKSLAKANVKHLVIVARREEVLRQAVREVEAARDAVQSTTHVACVALDVSDGAAVAAAMPRVRALCGGDEVNLLICNAGFAIPKRFADCTPADAHAMMSVNYFGCLHLIWAVLPGMLASRNGRIVLTSSMAAEAPIAGYALYAATKAAVRAMAHSIDMENSCLGVRAQIVTPPDVDTPGYEEENRVKSPECLAVSSFGGAQPFTAGAMAEAVVRGICRYRFNISLGSDGFLLGLGCAGMEPSTSVLELLLSVVGGGIIRLALAAISRIHYGIVKKVRRAEAAETNPPPKKSN